jgi:hypothetical protein
VMTLPSSMSSQQHGASAMPSGKHSISVSFNTVNMHMTWQSSVCWEPNFCCFCSLAGDSVPWLLAGSLGTLLLLPFPGAVTGIWATQRRLQLAQTVCPSCSPCLGCSTVHVAWNATWVPPQAQDTPCNLVTQAVAYLIPLHVKALSHGVPNQNCTHMQSHWLEVILMLKCWSSLPSGCKQHISDAL